MYLDKRIGLISVLPLLFLTPAPVHVASAMARHEGNSARSVNTDTLNMKVMVPAYFDPGTSNYWNRMAAQAAKMPGRLFVIANPNSGPGSHRQASYTAAIDTMHADSGKVIGYVWTNYGAVPLATVESQIDAWYSFYPSLDGIFLDGQANVTGKETYYQQLYAYVKQKSPASLTVGNPGTNTIENYLIDNGQRVTDVICIFETYPGFDTWTPSSWVSKYGRDNFYVIPYNASSTQWANDVRRAASLNIGWTYLTDATLPNPYDRLPNYFEDYCNFVRSGVDTSTSTGSGGIITIDGQFTDWQRIPPLTPAPAFSSPDSDAEITAVWAANDTANLYLSYRVAGTINTSKYFYHIFIDTDQDSAKGKTGYVYNDSAFIGAEYMVENNALWKYNGPGGANWSWVSASGMYKADSAGRTEISIPLTVLGHAGGRIQAIFEVNMASTPFSLMDVAPASYQTQCYVYQLANVTAITPRAPAAPSGYSLNQNYPNPFNPTTVIRYTLARPGFVSIRVYTVLGQEVSAPVDEIQSPGVHDITLSGAGLASGVYFYSLRAGDFFAFRKMLLVK